MADVSEHDLPLMRPVAARRMHARNLKTKARRTKRMHRPVDRHASDETDATPRFEHVGFSLVLEFGFRGSADAVIVPLDFVFGRLDRHVAAYAIRLG